MGEVYGINGGHSRALPGDRVQRERHRICDKTSLMKVCWLHKPNAGPGSGSTTSLKGPIVPCQSLSLSALKWPLWPTEWPSLFIAWQRKRGGVWPQVQWWTVSPHHEPHQPQSAPCCPAHCSHG
ncbi:unnamed protein product [Pleuronectes platessa]|uniref:Uncharacterized protein n=1 Tax=Pleuronectes platessa TaxID=8262 RepID=A0A9N7UDV1_PLEPL|nr:unnamed protein product [Pleuronectes platessa]